MSPKTTKWTSSDDATLVRMSIEKATIKTIARKLRRSESAVRNRANLIRQRLARVTKVKKKSGKTRQGHRPYLGVSVRSSWEANFLNFLNHQHIKWTYEPQMFIFHDIERGTRAYLPDVFLTEDDIWIEVKGMLRPQDKTKIRRFKKYYPEDFSKLQCVVKNSKVESAKFFESMNVPVYEYYDDLLKEYHNISNWEH